MATKSVQKTLVFVPGIFGIKYEWQPLRKIAECAGFKVVVFNYTTWGKESYFSVEKKLSAFLKHHNAVGVVGYSLGGTIAVGAHHSLPIFAVCSIFNGTATGYLYPSIGFRQIRFDSKYLATVRNKIRAHNVTSVYSYLDWIIIPGTSSRAGNSVCVWCPVHAWTSYWPMSREVFRKFLSKL